MISQWEHPIPAITCDEGIRCHSTRIQSFYFNDNFSRIPLWVSLPSKQNIGANPQRVTTDILIEIKQFYSGPCDYFL